MTKKIPVVFLPEGDPLLNLLDPNNTRIVSGAKTSSQASFFSESGDLGGLSSLTINPVVATEASQTNNKIGADGAVSFVIANPAVLLSDISIKSQEIDYSQNPPKVTVTFRVKNSTGLEVKGLNVKVPKQW